MIERHIDSIRNGTSRIIAGKPPAAAAQSPGMKEMIVAVPTNVAVDPSQMRHLGAPDLVLPRHAGDVGTGTADPAPIGPRHVPSQQLAAGAAADNQDLEPFPPASCAVFRLEAVSR
jgi:hypothetical protein